MSHVIAAAEAHEAATRRGRPSWSSLLVSIVVLFATVALILSGLLVRLANNHEGHSILPPEVGSGQSASGEVTLTNQGLLPVEVTLRPRASGTLPSGLSATVQRIDDGAFLYQGPLLASMGPLEVIQPGQASRLRLSITSTDTHGTASVPINFTYYWSGRPALPWWWWIPTVIGILLIVGLGYRSRRRPVAAGA
jgi:hypothetical protein